MISVKLSRLAAIGALLIMPMLAAAQSPLSGFMQGKGQSSLALSYSAERYENVFLVPQEIPGVPIFNEVSVTAVSLYGAYGINDKLDVTVNLPYISARGAASPQVLDNLGYENTRQGLQDIAAYLRYNPLNLNLGSGRLDFIGALGIQTPLGGYRIDEGLQSIIAIGNRATQLNAMAIAMYKSDMGIFASGQLGYSLRSNEVPNAFLSELRAGYAAKAFYFDAYIAGQLSSSGVDILGEGFDGNFAATRVNYTRVGLNLFVPVFEGISIGGGFNRYIDGRNLGKSTGFSGTMVVSF